MNYLEATHAAPSFFVSNGVVDRQHVVPCVESGSKILGGKLTFWYIDCVDGHDFYTYEPLPVWGHMNRGRMYAE